MNAGIHDREPFDAQAGDKASSPPCRRRPALWRWRWPLLATALCACVAAAVLLAEHGRPDSVLAHDTLPFYGSGDLRPRWSTIAAWHRVERFALRDQRGDPVDERLLDRGPTVVSFFFGGCATVCPVSTDLLRRTRATLAAGGRENMPQFVSITVTPLSDDPPRLRAYAQRFGLGDGWTLLTGDPEQVSGLARRGFFSDIESPVFGAEPPHVDRAFLVDASRRIRGIYDATSTNEMTRLTADLARLRSAPASSGAARGAGAAVAGGPGVQRM
jgi:protein SCO1